MSKWTLSLTDLANQAEAFLEQVDKKTAVKLQESNPGSEDEGAEEVGLGNFFSSLNSSVSVAETDLEIDKSGTRSGSDSGSHSSPEIIDPLSAVEEVKNKEHISQKELENTLIKQEIIELTKEIGLISNKLHDSQGQIEVHQKWESASKRKMEQLQSEFEKRGNVVRSYKDRESDLNDAIMAKDTQIGVLKVRLAEADAELSAQSSVTRNLKEELKVTSTGFAELTELRSAADLSNKQLLEYKERVLIMQQEVSERDSESLFKITDTTAALRSAEQQLKAEKRKCDSVISELKLSKSELDLARKDLADYKDRATRVLQAKEKRGSHDTSILDDESAEMLIQERNHFEHQYRSAKTEVEAFREHVSSTEQLHTEELQQALDKCSHSEDGIRERDLSISQYQLSMSRLKEEVYAAQKEVASQRVNAAAQLRVLQEEVATTRRTSNTQPDGQLEGKIKSLTEVLITKQTEVERLHSERSSLVMKLESLESVLLSVERKNNQVSVPVEKEGFINTQVHENVRLRDALNSIDKFSIRLGVFLRRYPHARLMVIGYMLLLHGWVMVVLLTYSPEVH